MVMKVQGAHVANKLLETMSIELRGTGLQDIQFENAFCGACRSGPHQDAVKPLPA